MIFISGPSTVGKNPLIESICKTYNYNFLVPWTTRKMRQEENGINDYHFVSKEEFKSAVINNTIEEWDYALSNYYGFGLFDARSKKMITHGLSRMTIRIKKKHPKDITTIFLMPYDKNKIFEVLRRIYNGDELALRLALVEEEILHSTLFDYVFEVKNNSKELLCNSEFLEILSNN
ncbi:MAG: hypothetical protein IJ265_03140 [Oscillospiraceae bacterium]|nr:hypothetical protein [Oscillospiraceae bacterium]